MATRKLLDVIQQLKEARKCHGSDGGGSPLDVALPKILKHKFHLKTEEEDGEKDIKEEVLLVCLISDQ